MKIISIVGARPQFIKEAIVQEELRKQANVEHIVLHTGQHYDAEMSTVFFDTLKMRPPDYMLGIKAQLHGEMTGLMLIELERVFLKERPDIVLLYGDTNSTVAGALAAAKLKLRTAHVEAGLRQTPRWIPEEVNRVVTDRVSDVLFAPSQLAMGNLQREGLLDRAVNVGDVMYDLYLRAVSRFDTSVVDRLRLEGKRYIVMTLHRDFNVDKQENLAAILSAANTIAAEQPVVFPVHPRTAKRIAEFGLESLAKNITIVPPLDYLSLMGLTQHASFVITDSGGYQKEAYFAGKRAAIIMEDTGWRELVESGYHVLASAETLYDAVYASKPYRDMGLVYGAGDAAAKIVKHLVEIAN